MHRRIRGQLRVKGSHYHVSLSGGHNMIINPSQNFQIDADAFDMGVPG